MPSLNNTLISFQPTGILKITLAEQAARDSAPQFGFQLATKKRIDNNKSAYARSRRRGLPKFLLHLNKMLKHTMDKDIPMGRKGT